MPTYLADDNEEHLAELSGTYSLDEANKVTTFGTDGQADTSFVLPAATPWLLLEVFDVEEASGDIGYQRYTTNVSNISGYMVSTRAIAAAEYTIYKIVATHYYGDGTADVYFGDESNAMSIYKSGTPFTPPTASWKMSADVVSPYYQIVHTDWGFQDFSVPDDGVSVPAGGDIQAAIDSLTSGGTVTLAAGAYTGSRITLKSNIVLEGAGKDLTTISFNGGVYDMLILSDGNENIVLRGFTADCTGSDEGNGIIFTGGTDNFLFEDIKIFGADKSNVIVYNGTATDTSYNITFKDVLSYGANLFHAFAVRHCHGVIYDNCTAQNVTGYGFDISNSEHVEIANCYATGCGTGGSKYPATKYVYVHDTNFVDNPTAGMVFTSLIDGIGGGTQGIFHIEDVTVNNCDAGIVDWGDQWLAPSVDEMSIKNVTSINNNYNTARIRGVVDGHEFGDNIGMMVERATGTGDTSINTTPHTTGSPADYGAGYTTWGNP